MDQCATGLGWGDAGAGGGVPRDVAQRRLAEERRRGKYEEMLKRDLEEEARQAAAAQAAAQPPTPALPARAQPDMAALWNTAFAWAGPAPTLIDLTDPEDDDDV